MTTANDATIEDLRITRTYDAPPERVFDAWTDADQFRAWAWGSVGRDVAAEIDARDGGAYRTTTRSPKEGSWTWSGIFHALDRPRRLAISIDWDAPMGYESDVEGAIVEFAPDGAGTAMTFIHRGVPSAKAREVHREGWNDVFDTLGRHLAGE